jgi:hypothetical protein
VARELGIVRSSSSFFYAELAEALGTELNSAGYVIHLLCINTHGGFEMANITLAIEEEVIKKVRKVALERNTTLTALVRENLRQIAVREDMRTEELISELKECFNVTQAKVGKKKWTREELHAR